MKKMKILVAVMLVLTLASCNFPFAGTSDDDLATSVAQTVEAMESKMQQPTLPLPAATATPMATSTPMPTATVEATEESEPCLYAYAVDVTVPDGTVMSPGQTFTKTWKFTNAGYCDWNTDYRLSFKSGDQMGAPDYVKVSTETDFGETIKISVDMKAPSSDGTYKGYWQLETNKGVKFGEVWVQIKVE
jgi:hypothetical protein